LQKKKFVPIVMKKELTLNYKHQLIILLLLALGLNINTLFNEYAMDDVVVVTGNTLVTQGVKGIPKILSTDFFYGLVKTESGFSGGRYRPFALVIFALEYQFFGANPFAGHLINVLLFALLIGLLFVLLQRHIFKEQHHLLAFITCLLFVVHPIHTEVIANIKSRDEIITFILLLATLFAFIKYSEKRSVVILLLGLFCFFVALLTRESAVPFIGIVPLVAYFFLNQSIKRSLLLTIPLFTVFGIYAGIRVTAVGFSHSTQTHILNSPFLYATSTQTFATKVFILAKYVGLLVFPHPLSFDYGYNQIPYIGLNSMPFALSAIFFIGLISYAIFSYKKRSLFSFCIFYFLTTIFLFANFIADVGAPMAERLLFQPSFAFCVFIAVLYLRAARRFNLPAKFILSIILILFSIKTISRNSDWKNNETLILADAQTAGDNVRINLWAAKMYMNKALATTNEEVKNEYFKKAIFHDEKTLKIYPADISVYQNLGIAYWGLQDYLKAADNYKQVYKLVPSDSSTRAQVESLSEILYNEGNKFYKKGNTFSAISYYKKSVELKESNADVWHNLSLSYFRIGDTLNGNIAKQTAEKISSNFLLK